MEHKLETHSPEVERVGACVSIMPAFMSLPQLEALQRVKDRYNTPLEITLQSQSIPSARPRNIRNRNTVKDPLQSKPTISVK
jgi:hypothetical protein